MFNECSYIDDGIYTENVRNRVAMASSSDCSWVQDIIHPICCCYGDVTRFNKLREIGYKDTAKCSMVDQME